MTTLYVIQQKGKTIQYNFPEAVIFQGMASGRILTYKTCNLVNTLQRQLHWVG